MLAEMGVAIHTDGHTVGLFQPRRVSNLITVTDCAWSVYVKYLKVISYHYENEVLFKLFASLWIVVSQVTPFFKAKVGIPYSVS